MSEVNYSENEREGATAPSSASSGAGTGDDRPSVEDPLGTATCEVCGLTFGSGRGLSLHQRSRHQEWYHARRGPAFVRPGWSREEMVLLVRAAVRLVREARRNGHDEGRVRVNAELCRLFPTKKKDSIINVRKTKNYKELRARIELEVVVDTEENEPVPEVENEAIIECVGGSRAGIVSSDGSEGGALSPTRSQQVVRQRVTPEPVSRRGPQERWGEVLLEEVARGELRLSGLNTRFMNAALRKSFPSRTLEAIKGMRRKPKYRLLLASLSVPNPVATPPGPSQSEEGTVVPKDTVRSEGSSPQRLVNDTQNVVVYCDRSTVSNFCGILQPPCGEGNSPPGNDDMLPVASDPTKGGRPEIVPHNVTYLSDMDMSSSIDYTLVPADITQGDVTICNSSVVEISSLGVDTPPHRRVVELSSANDEDDRRDEAEVELPETELDVDEESEPSSQPCNPRQGDVSQTVGEGGGRTVAGH